MRVELLKQMLAVPSPSYREKAMVEFIVRHVEQMGPRCGVRCRVDEHNNVYITKGDAEFLPCVAAHIDTVHRLAPATIVQHGGLVVGFDEAGRRTGIGGDDKAGVYICLDLLERFDNIAVALFAAEEVGCVGSRNADPDFFKRVGYLIEFDCPGRGLISYTSGGVRLFQNHGDFITTALPIMCRHGALNWQNHPFSDVKAIGGRFGLCCLNVSAGYYNWHRRDEFVKLADVEHALAFGTDLIRALGNRRYDFDSSVPDLADPAVPVTDLNLDTLMNTLDWDWKTSTPFDPANPDPWLESLVQPDMLLLDYTLHDGQSTAFNTETVPASDVTAVEDGWRDERTCQPPFDDFKFSLCPWRGAARFTVYRQGQQLLVSVLATNEATGREAWAQIESRWQTVRRDRPDFYAASATIARPTPVPFLATLVMPAWQQHPEFRALAVRFRNAVAVALLHGEWFEPDDVRRARMLAEAASRPAPAPCRFDLSNPTPWLEYQIAQNDPTLHPLAQRAMMLVYRGWLSDDAFIRATTSLPPADEHGAWCFWNARTNRITEPAGQPPEPGVVAVHQRVADLCAEDKLAARVLRVRALGAVCVL